MCGQKIIPGGRDTKRQHWIMGMEAVVQRGLEISPEETAAATKFVCEPNDSSITPPGIPANDHRSRMVTELPHHKDVYTLLV
jgi:hypothetical protein